MPYSDRRYSSNSERLLHLYEYTITLPKSWEPDDIDAIINFLDERHVFDDAYDENTQLQLLLSEVAYVMAQRLTDND